MCGERPEVGLCIPKCLDLHCVCELKSLLMEMKEESEKVGLKPNI